MALCFSAQKQRHKCDSNQDTMTETLKYPKKKKNESLGHRYFGSTWNS